MTTDPTVQTDNYELTTPYYSVIPTPQSTSNPLDMYLTTIADTTDRQNINNPEILATGQYENVGDGKKPMDVTAQYVKVDATQGGLSGEISSGYANVP